MEWTDKQITQWHQQKQAYFADTLSVNMYEQIKQQQLRAQQDMLQVLNAFLDNTLTMREFNTIFQQRTHGEWNIFQLRGMSGGLFFNKLIKYISHEEAFTHLLRMMLRVPVDLQDGQQHMKAFVHFLEDVISSEHVERWQLQPARVPFFLSVWWHIQQIENWPIFSFRVRRAILDEEKAFTSLQNPIDRYFLFKTRFLALKQTLDLTGWELERLINWHSINSTSYKESPSPLSSSKSLGTMNNQKCFDSANTYANTISRKGNRIYKRGQQDANHTYIQWVLAKIGLKIGCSVWIAVDDHEKMWGEERLGDLSLSSLPLMAHSLAQQIIQHIDILWLRKNEIVAAYEIELTTADISKSLLRLSDIAVLFPKRDLPLCVVTPQRCFDTVQSELSRPIFQDHDIRKRSKVIIQEHLVENAEHILRWANSPSVVHDLTLYLSAKEV